MNVSNQKKCGSILLVKNSPILPSIWTRGAYSDLTTQSIFQQQEFDIDSSICRFKVWMSETRRNAETSCLLRTPPFCIILDNLTTQSILLVCLFVKIYWHRIVCKYLDCCLTAPDCTGIVMVSIGQRFAFPCALTLEGDKNCVALCTISTWLPSVLFLLVALLSFFLFTLLRSSLTFQRSKKLCCPLYLFQVVLFSQFLHFLGSLPKIVNDPRPHDLFICRSW